MSQYLKALRFRTITSLVNGSNSPQSLEVECLFSEKATPISQLVKGSPDRPLREPVTILLACIFNIFQIYQLVELRSRITSPYDPFFDWFQTIIASTVPVLIGWYIIFSGILVIGASVIYWLNRRAGGAIVLVISIIGLLMGFVGMSITMMISYSTLFVTISFLAPVFGLVAGIWGVRAEKPLTTEDMQEII